jgi:hypothetical protein
VARKYETVLKKSDLPVRETVPLLDNILTVLRSTVLTNSSLSRTRFRQALRLGVSVLGGG